MEAVDNKDKTVLPGWSEKSLAIADMSTSVHRYFVRVAGRSDAKKDTARKIFGAVSVIELEGMDEFALLTEKMAEADFHEKAEALEASCEAVGEKNILQMIRAEL